MAITLAQFMDAISGQESGGDYSATNKDSGAYGRFQIMPANWPSWSQEAGLGGQPPTPQNQDRVAAFKMQQYYNASRDRGRSDEDAWADVASTWYSGSPVDAYNQHELTRDQNGYPSIQSYVNSIMGKLGSSGGSSGYPGPPRTGNGVVANNGANDPTFKMLQQKANELLTRWAQNGSSIDDPLYDDWTAANEALQGYMVTNGIDPSATGGAQDTSDLIGDWAQIEGIEESKANRALRAWESKTNNAMQAAGAELDYLNGRNTELDTRQQARNESSTPGLTGRNLTAGVGPVNSEALVKKWREQFGVSGDAPAERAASTPPSLGNPTGTPGGGQWTTTINGGMGALPPNFGGVGYDVEGDTLPADDIGSRTTPDLRGTPRYDPLAQSPSWSRNAAPVEPSDWEKMHGRSSTTGQEIGSVLDVVLGRVANQVGGNNKSGTKKTPWYKRLKGYADGGVGIPQGQALVGERAPELYIRPDGSSEVVGQNGPEQRMLVEGSSIIPMDQAYALHNIEQGVNQQAGGTPEERAADPMVAQKAMEALQRALSSVMAANPPATPVPYGGAKDRFGAWRNLSGIPYDPAVDPALQPAAASKK